MPPSAEVLTRIQAIARVGVLLLGGLYTVGLLIVNLDLGHYGLLSLDLARPEYVMAGALWTFLTVITWAAAAVAIGNVKQILLSKPSAWTLVKTLLEFAMFVGFLLYLVSVLSRNELVLTKRTALLPTGTIIINAVVLKYFLESLRAVVESQPLSIKILFSRIPKWTPAYSTIAMLSVISLYATFAFPHFPRELGGGRKPVVQLLLTDQPLQEQWENLGLPVSEDRRGIGPVVLLLKTNTTFTVRRVEKHNDKGWLPVRSAIPAVAIRKDMVVALIYRPTGE